MDKVTIDGVDVSGCNNIDEWKHCNICQVLIKTIPNRNQCLTEGDLRCEFYPDCYYKQLKRKEQECEKLKWLLETKCQSEWEKENAELKAENEKLKTDISIYKGIIDSDKEENERLKEELRVAQMNRMTMFEKLDIVNEKDTYKQALREIREMVDCANCEYESNNCNPQQCSIIEIKINEVIGAE